MGKRDDIAHTLGPGIRPVAKAILKAGLNVSDAAEKTVAEARERLTDFVAEVRKEMNPGVKRKASSKKAVSRQGRPKK